jgi:hypothetical protein
MTPIADGNTITNVVFSDEGTIANATSTFSAQTNPGPVDSTLTPALETHIGEQAATVALGHTPTVVNDAFFKGTGDQAGFNYEYLQYDQIGVVVIITPAS